MSAAAAPDHPHPVDAALAAWCLHHEPPANATVAVAFSAGADSTAVLLAAQARWPGRLVALHVHHGLQAAGDGFEALARQTCGLLQVPLQVRHLDASPRPGQSPEDAARDHRYRALAEMARAAGVAVVLLGQHADDQAETLILALSRGAGLPGLAGMGDRFERHGVVFGRPLLALPAALLRARVQQVGHAFVDDPTNADPRFTRNRIRQMLLPALEQCFPGFRSTLARSMRHAAQAQTLLTELAQIDLQATGRPPAIAALQSLSRERQGNALRCWLREHASASPSEAQLEQLLDQIAVCRTRGHRIHLKVAGGFMVRDGACLRYTPSV